MTKASLQSSLQFVNANTSGLELYFLYQQDNDKPIQILRADLEGTNTQQRLELVFTNKVKSLFFTAEEKEGEKVKELNTWNLKHIKDVDELKNTFYYFPNQPSVNEDYHIPEAFLEMVNVSNNDYTKFEHFNFTNHLLDDVFAYIIRLQIDSSQVILFAQKYPVDILSRSTVLRVAGYNALQHPTRFTLDNDPLLRVSDRIDFIFIDNNFIIVNLKLLESKYGFNERYLKRGADALRLIKSKDILTNYETLDKLSITVPFSKKLMKIKTDNEVLKASITDMNNFLKNYKTKDGKSSLAKRIKFLPKQNKFEIKTNIGAEDFIRLLNDEYLISLLTKITYISEIKSDFTA